MTQTPPLDPCRLHAAARIVICSACGGFYRRPRGAAYAVRVWRKPTRWERVAAWALAQWRRYVNR
jgi:hypothetical protein